MIESMLPDEEQEVLRLGTKLERIKREMSDIQGSNRGHLNLPMRVREAYLRAYTDAERSYVTTKFALMKAIRIADELSPGCSVWLLQTARESVWGR